MKLLVDLLCQMELTCALFQLTEKTYRGMASSSRTLRFRLPFPLFAFPAYLVSPPSLTRDDRPCQFFELKSLLRCCDPTVVEKPREGRLSLPAQQQTVSSGGETRCDGINHLLVSHGGIASHFVLGVWPCCGAQILRRTTLGE